jgi:nitrous oxide reductase
VKRWIAPVAALGLASAALLAAPATQAMPVPQGRPGCVNTLYVVEFFGSGGTGSVRTVDTTTNLPSKQHFDLISTFVGEWTTTTTSFNGETNEPTTSTGQARFFPAMNGRFICGDLEGTLFGKPFKGMGLWGFNTNQNRFERDKQKRSQTTWQYRPFQPP